MSNRGQPQYTVLERAETVPPRDDNTFRNKRKVIYAIEKAIREGKLEPPKYGPI